MPEGTPEQPSSQSEVSEQATFARQVAAIRMSSVLEEEPLTPEMVAKARDYIVWSVRLNSLAGSS